MSGSPSASGLRPIVDLFAGPGGWSEGLRLLGYSELGIEWDEAACLTARAAGHERLQADVAELDPLDFSCTGLIASPPCQAWSTAGKRGGRRDIEHVIACSLELAAGGDTRAEHAAKCEDHRSLLVVEPLRWALAIAPHWIALEQVPPVMELWSLYAQILGAQGYSVWCGVLEAERYGVPQTRERAILMASRQFPVHPPQPTHQRYVKGEPQRREWTLDGEILPWVSMAEALAWTDASVAFHKHRSDNFQGDRRDPSGEPAPVIDGKTRSCTWLRAGTNANDVARSGGEPAPTLRFGARANAVDWVGARPATTVQCDPRIAAPGHKGDKRTEPNAISQMEGAVRVTVEEASVLQSFRADYPWHGSRTKQFQQVGNAVPPLLARAVLGELTDPVEMEVRDAA